MIALLRSGRIAWHGERAVVRAGLVHSVGKWIGLVR
jgi:hypothetical protein